MDKRDLLIKYKKNLGENRVEGIWNDIYSVNKVIRYGKSVGDIVDMICVNVVRVMELENQFKSIKYDLDRIQNTNRVIRLSGVEILKKENRLNDYVKTLDKDERDLISYLDLGINDVVDNVKRNEFKERQNGYSRSYSMNNG